MSRFDALPSRIMTPSTAVAMLGTTLVQVSWDAGPDLQDFQQFISAYAKGRFSSGLAERVTLASNELLDNAVRYGSLAREFSYRLSLETSRICVFVQNATVMARIEMLTAHLKRLEGGVEQVYVSELERSTQSGGRRSMLGLARVRHEAEMKIDLTLDGLDVMLKAHCPR